MLDELRDEMATQQERFDNKDSVEKKRSDKRLELSTKIGELTQQLGGYETIIIMAGRSSIKQLTSSVALRLLCQYFARQSRQRL
jgi:hypothetical protein